MKSSRIKSIVIIALIALPIIVWAINNQNFELRQRATDEGLTPTPSVTPSATPTITPTPTNSPPNCSGLSVNPIAGGAPLTVNFSCAGYDPDNDITAVEFGFGDTNKRLVEKSAGQFGSITTTYTYNSTGSYHVTCRVRDNNMAYSDYPQSCQSTVNVYTKSASPAATRVPTPISTSSALAGPIIYTGLEATTIPTVTPYPSPTIEVVPTSAPATNTPAIGQLVKVALVSIVTIIIALLLHRFIGGPD